MQKFNQLSQDSSMTQEYCWQAYFWFWYQVLEVVIEAEVDHVEDTITGEDWRQALVETAPSKAVLSHYLPRLRVCRLLLDKTKTRHLWNNLTEIYIN